MLSLIHAKRLRHKRYVDGQNGYVSHSTGQSARPRDSGCRRKVNGDGDRVVWCYGLFTLQDPDLDSCTMQKFHIGSDPDSDPLIGMYGIGTDICP